MKDKEAKKGSGKADAMRAQRERQAAEREEAARATKARPRRPEEVRSEETAHGMAGDGNLVIDTKPAADTIRKSPAKK